MSFKVGEQVSLKVSLMKEVMRLGKKGMLSPSYIDLFEVLGDVGLIAYRLALHQACQGYIRYFMHRFLKDIMEMGISLSNGIQIYLIRIFHMKCSRWLFLARIFKN